MLFYYISCGCVCQYDSIIYISVCVRIYLFIYLFTDIYHNAVYMHMHSMHQDVLFTPLQEEEME